MGVASCVSLSARRAWIEMRVTSTTRAPCTVALRKESVDRNIRNRLDYAKLGKSLSARRAWIEICSSGIGGGRPPVALRKESVDRNNTSRVGVSGTLKSLSARRAWIEMSHNQREASIEQRRSPQGERGMFLFLTVQGGFVHADIRFNFKNCYSKKLSHKII